MVAIHKKSSLCENIIVNIASVIFSLHDACLIENVKILFDRKLFLRDFAPLWLLEIVLYRCILLYL